MRIGFVYIYAGSCPVKGVMGYGLHDAPGSQLATRRAWAPFGSAKYRAPVAGNTPALDGEPGPPVPKAGGRGGGSKSADGSGKRLDVGAGVDAAVQTTQVPFSEVVAETQRVAQEGSDASTQTNTAATTDRGADALYNLDGGESVETQTAADNGVDQLIERIKVRLAEMLTVSEETVRAHDFEKWKTDHPAFADTMDKYVKEFNLAIKNAREAIPEDDVFASIDNLYYGLLYAARIHAFYDTGELVSADFEARQKEQVAVFRMQVQEAVDAQIARSETPLAEDAARRAEEVITKLNATIQILEAAKTEDSARFDVQASEAEGLQSELSRVQPLFEAAKLANIQLKSENRELASRGSETTANATELETAKTSILKETEARRGLEQDLAQKQATLDESNKRESTLTGDLHRAKAENAQLKKSVAENSAAFYEFDQERTQLQQQLKELQAQFDGRLAAAEYETRASADEDLRGGAYDVFGGRTGFADQPGLEGTEEFRGREPARNFGWDFPAEPSPGRSPPASADRGRSSRAATRPDLTEFIEKKENTIGAFMFFSAQKASFVAAVCNSFGTTRHIHEVNYQELQDIRAFSLPKLKTKTKQQFKSPLNVNTQNDNDRRTIMAIYSAVVFQLFFYNGFTCEYNPSKKNPTLDFSNESGDTFTIKFPQSAGRFEFRAGESRDPVTEAGPITKDQAPFFVHAESKTKGEYAEGESAGVV